MTWVSELPPLEFYRLMLRHGYGKQHLAGAMMADAHNPLVKPRVRAMFRARMKEMQDLQRKGFEAVLFARERIAALEVAPNA